jgi:hypothetical protein
MRLWSVLGLDSYHDDLLTTYRALDTPLSWGFLLDTYAGHWAPLGRILEWGTVRAAPFSAAFAFGVVLVLLLLADVGMAVALRMLAGPRLGAFAVFACWAFTPVLTTAVGSWSLGLSLILMVAGMCWALAAHLHAVARPGRWSAALAAGALGCLLLVNAQALLFVAFLLLLTWAYPQVRIRSVPGTGRPGIVLWSLYALVVTSYLAAYLAVGADRVTGELGVARLATVVREAVVGVAFPSLLGGPWASDAGALPSVAPLSSLMLSVALQVVLLAVAVSIAARRKAWRAWAALAMLVFLHSALLAYAVRFDVIPGLLRQTRYLVPLLVPAYILVACAFLLGPRRAWLEQRRHLPVVRWATALVVVLISVLIVESSWVSINRTAEAMKEASTATFWANVRDGLARHPNVTLIDRPMPEQVLAGGFIPQLKNTSSGLRYFVTDQSWNSPTDAPFVITDDGQIVPGKVEPFATSAPGPSPGCGYVVKSGTWTSVPVEPASFNWGWGVQLNYLASRPVTLETLASGFRNQVPVQGGIGNVIWVNPGVISEVRLRIADGVPGVVCADRITVGGLVPASAAGS